VCVYVRMYACMYVDVSLAMQVKRLKEIPKAWGLFFLRDDFFVCLIMHICIIYIYIYMYIYIHTHMHTQHKQCTFSCLTLKKTKDVSHLWINMSMTRQTHTSTHICIYIHVHTHARAKKEGAYRCTRRSTYRPWPHQCGTQQSALFSSISTPQPC
jgi:hypothetical protein